MARSATALTVILGCMLAPVPAAAKCSFGKIGGWFNRTDAFQSGPQHIKVKKIGDGLQDLLNPNPWVYIENYDGRRHKVRFSEYTKALRDCTGQGSKYPDWFADPNVGTRLTVEQSVVVPTASASSGLDAADLNGDGEVDLVSVRFGQGVAVSLGDGSDELPRTGTLFPAGMRPETLTLAEINGDGQPDLLVADEGDFSDDHGGLAVLIGLPNGAFAEPVRYEAGIGARSVAVADFNNDGLRDAAVASVGSLGQPSLPADTGGLFVLLNTGNGAFGAAARLAVGDSPASVLDADFNGDGDADLAVANDRSDSVSLLLSNGDGTFEPATDLAVGRRPTFLGTADFNGDGRSDLAVLHRYSATISMWMNDGAGGFAFAGRYQSGSSVASFEIVPPDTDPRPTIVSPDRSGARFLALGVDLAGTLAAPPVYLVGRDSHSVVAVDFDGNGRLDLAAATEEGVTVIANPAPRQFPQPEPQVIGGAVTRAAWVAAADLTGDGVIDLAGAQGGVFVLPGVGDGTFGAPNVIPGGSSSEFVAAADLNADGQADLIAVENTRPNGAVAVYLAGAGGAFARTAYPVGASPRQAAAGDFNGDGRPDLAVANAGDLQTPAGVSLLLANGPGIYQPAGVLPAGFSIDTVETGDFNGDGDLDLVAAGQIEGAPTFLLGYRMLLGNGDGTFQVMATVETTFGPTDMEAADFNADGLLDVALSHCCGSTDMTMLLGNGDGTFRSVSFPGGVSPQGLAAGDFDLDGALDLAVAGGDPQTFSGGTVSILDFALPSTDHVNAASSSPGVQAPDSIISAYGAMLSTATAAAPSPDWPTQLGGTRVMVRDSAGVEREAGVAFSSTGQVNYHMPAETAEGTATVTIATGAGREVSAEVVIRRIAPGLFQATPDGLAAAWVIRVKPGGAQILEPVVTLNTQNRVVAAPIDLSVDGDIVVLQLFGTGLRKRLNLSDVRVTIGGVECSVLYAGPQNEFPGLDQINVELPPSLRGAGLVQVVVEVEGVDANILQVRIR